MGETAWLRMWRVSDVAQGRGVVARYVPGAMAVRPGSLEGAIVGARPIRRRSRYSHCRPSRANVSSISR